MSGLGSSMGSSLGSSVDPHYMSRNLTTSLATIEYNSDDAAVCLFMPLYAVLAELCSLYRLLFSITLCLEISSFCKGRA